MFIDMIRFFLTNNLRSRKTIWIVLLAFIPVAFSLLLWVIRWTIKADISMTPIFSQIGVILFLRFLLPLISVFVGTSIISDEIETQTLPYLLVRPIPRWKIILTKTLSQIVTVVVILFISFLMTYTLLTLEGGFQALLDLLGKFFVSMGVLILGGSAYIALFGIFGGLLKRPVLAGIIFSFGWENLVSGFPGNMKYFTILYYLNNLYPLLKKSSMATVLLPSETFSPLTASLILLVMLIIFLFILLSLLHFKEYRLQRE